MSKFKFPNPLTAGALMWISQYNGAMQKISQFLSGMYTGIPLWLTYNSVGDPCILEQAPSVSFGNSPTISSLSPGDTLNRQYYGQLVDVGRKQTGADSPLRLDSYMADSVRVSFGGFLGIQHSQTPGSPAYFDKTAGTLTSAATGNLFVGVFLPNNEAVIYPNRE